MADEIQRFEAAKSSAWASGLLRSLVRDQRGNVLAITAAATIPMLAVVGGAVDISRVYVTKSRLQAACDAAVLAGRKAMNTTTYTSAAQARATSMFNVNFRDSDQSTSDTDFISSADAEGKVSGTATTTIPMVLMHIFGAGADTVSATCSADIQIPNIDVVMVLDVTGSMDSSINRTKKIDSLKEAAKDFYDTLADAMIGNTTSQIRYGLVPYAEAVNGKDVFKANPEFQNRGELPLSHLVNTMTVQSRVANMETWVSEWVPDPNSTPTVHTQQYRFDHVPSLYPFEPVSGASDPRDRIQNDDCTRYASNLSFQINSSTATVTLFPETRWPGREGVGASELYRREGSSNWETSAPTTGNSYVKITFQRSDFTGGSRSSSTGLCTRRVTQTRYIKREGWKFTNWSYKPVDYDVSSYKAGSALTYVTSVPADFLVSEPGEYDPVRLARMSAGIEGGVTFGQGTVGGSNTTWDGCLEERDTVAAATFAPIPSGAFDLNAIVGGTNQQTRWRPFLRELTYNRGQAAERLRTTSNYSNPASSCPSARMQSLRVMTKAEFDGHVDSLQPEGNTYLDVGMIWGLRLIAPQGMFAARNLTGPNGGQISRHIIFLTDGEPVSNTSRYTAYGVEAMERRIAGNTGVAQATLHSRRFQALCDSHRGAISIWAIAFGTSVTGNMQGCADPGRAFQANNTNELKAAFRRIAREVADLRLVE